jgi:Xaa-Pro aminopeptidase
MAHVRERLRPGMKESEVGALWNGWVHAHGTGWNGKVELAHGFSLVWSGPGIRTFTATGDRPVQEREPTLFEIWVCADGYWCDHTKNLCPGELTSEYDELLELLLRIFDEAARYATDGADLPELDRLIRSRIAEGGYPGQPSHPVAHGVGARAHEPPYAHQAGSGQIRSGMVLAIEPGIYWEGGGGLRLEDNFLVTQAGNEKLCSFPDDFRG